MTDQDGLARAASDAIDAWCAENPAPEAPHWAADMGGFSPVAERVQVTYCARRPRERVQARLMLEGCTHDFQPRAGHYPEIVCGKCGVIVDENGPRFEDEETHDG